MIYFHDMHYKGFDRRQKMTENTILQEVTEQTFFGAVFYFREIFITFTLPSKMTGFSYVCRK